ncbi:MAG: AEC family transporter [Clostridia bacterium]|nr:AEC family transporter [Clostridia bacterium]
MLTVFWLTLQKVCVLLCFFAVGYILRRGKVLDKSSERTLSMLCAHVFLPAFTFRQLVGTLTPDNLREDGALLLAGCFWLAGSIPFAFLMRRLLGKTPEEKAAYTYLFTFSNYGYFGYPVVAGVFGDEALGKMILFLLPFTIALNSFGYALFVPETGFRKLMIVLLKTPMLWFLIAGSVIGLLRIPLPGAVGDIASAAGACMSPCSMLLAGMVLANFPLRDMVRGGRGFLVVTIRMLGMPLLGLGVCLALGLEGYDLLFPLVMLAMPLPLNTVIFPESRGQDASASARMVCQSTVFALLTLPPLFALFSHLAGM